MGAAARGVIRVAQRPLGQIVMVVAVLFALGTSERWWPSARAKAPLFRRRIVKLFDSALPVVGELAAHHQAASAAWSDGAYHGHERSLTQEVARVLGASPTPLNRTQIAETLLPGAASTAKLVGTLGRVLASSGVFVQANARSWQLGRAGVDFGFRIGGEASEWRETRRPPTWLLRALDGIRNEEADAKRNG